MNINKIKGDENMRTLNQLNQTYEEIIHSTLQEPDRSIRLADLMTEMEGTYKIPLLKNEAWESQNRAV